MHFKGSVKTSVNYLGCTLGSNAGGAGMALKVVGKVTARTKFLARKSVFLDRESWKLVVSSLIQCHSDYASLVLVLIMVL